MKDFARLGFDRRAAASNLLLIMSCVLSLAVVALGLGHVSQLMSGCLGCGESGGMLPGPFGVALAGLVMAVALAIAGARVRYPAQD